MTENLNEFILKNEISTTSFKTIHKLTENKT